MSQVNSVVQVNATSARIGTSAATPADGDVVVSGAVKAAKAELNATDYHLKLQDGAGNPWYLRAPDGSLRMHLNGTGDVLLFDGTGNITQLGGSPEYHFGTTSASHYNWRIACQETTDGAFEIASGTQSAGSSAASDTYTPRFLIDGASGKVKIANTSAPDTQLSVECDTTGEAIGDGIRVQNAHGVNNDIAPVYFGVHGGTRRAKAAIGLKRTGSYGIGELRFAVDSNGDDADVNFANDTKLTIDSTGLATFTNGITVSGGFTTLGSFSEVTISGGGVAVTSSTHRVDTENETGSDDLYGITGVTDGSILVLQSVTSTRDVTVKHSNGTTGQNIRLAGGADFAMDTSNYVLALVKYGSNWREVSRSNNS